MRVAFIGQKGIPAKVGGVEKHVEDLAVGLVRSGHEALVYTRHNYTDQNLKTYKGVELVSLPSVSTKNLDAITGTFFACLDLMRRKVDVIHFHAIGPSSLVWLAKLLNPRTPIVFTFHCQDYYHQKWGFLAKAYLKFGEYIGCHFADKIITISEALTEYTKVKYNREASFVPNGVNLPETKSAQLIKQWGLEENNYIVAITRLVRHKGLQYLIKAYQDLNTNKKLVIVGDGAYTDDYVRELKALAFGNPNIIFTGVQSGEVLTELFSNAYLFVQPSESEGLSIALLEAMSYSRACLVSDIPGNLEAIGRAGLIFANKDVIDLKNKLGELLDNPELVAALGAKSRQRVETYYDWSNIVKQIEAIYKEVLVVKAKMSLKEKIVSWLF